jgi:hypothetical protein
LAALALSTPASGALALRTVASAEVSVEVSMEAGADSIAQGIHGRSTGAGLRHLCYRRTVSPLNHYRRRARGGSLDLPLECNWLRAMVPVDPGLDSRRKK